MASAIFSPLLAPALAIQKEVENVANLDLNWKAIVLSFMGAMHLLETYLTLRQYPMYSKKSPPESLKEKFTPEVFEKSQKYGKDKARFSLISSTYTFLLEAALIYFNANVWAWEAAGTVVQKASATHWTHTDILQSIAFIAIVLPLSSIPTIPFSYYKTFVLEAKHGFNKSTVGLFFSDILKGWLLGFAIGAPFLAGFLWIIKWAGDSFIPWLMAFLITFQLIMVVLYPLVIQPFFNTLVSLPQGALRSRVEALATRLKFPLSDLYMIDGSKRSSHSNAYFYGLPWSKHIVIFDTLINQSTPEEIEAVLAHELGHWSHSHPMKLLIVSQLHLLTILSAFPPFLKSQALVKSFGFSKSVYGNPPTLIAFLLFQSLLTPLEALFGLVQNAISRRFEWEADRFALELGHGSAPEDEHASEKEKPALDDMGARLARALIGLHVENLSTVWVDWLYSAYHNSHPTLTERLRAMDDWRSKQPSRKTS